MNRREFDSHMKKEKINTWKTRIASIRDMDRRNVILGITGILSAVVIGVAITAVLKVPFSQKDPMQEEIKKGVEYIKNLETTDIGVIEKQVKEIRAKERKEALENGDLNVWAQFDDSVVMGDSRAVGFYYFGFMDSSRVFAEGGATIRDIEKYTEQIKSLNPSSIFLAYGLNDISIGYWSTAEEYVAEYDEKLAMLKELVPDTDIYVILTIPATDPAFDTASIWRQIPEWNVVMEEHFTETGTRFIDISDTIAEHSDLYDEDGIHLQKEFYDYWAITILSEVMEYE